MIRVNVSKTGNFPINVRKLKSTLQDFFRKEGIVSDAEVSVAIVGETKMLDIGKKYLHEKGKPVHSVLSFTPEEVRGKFVYPPDGLIHLGEIILCYPCVVAEAKKAGRLIDVVVGDLLQHSALHLMGKHHQ
jgi:rRNA maturation RNase YbeY